tara:strand:+ start:225 stop:398 length:174 start_codon:yes stop_codon:yes gene_type:complete
MKALLSVLLLFAFGAYAWSNTPARISGWEEAAEGVKQWLSSILGGLMSLGKAFLKNG